MKLNDVILVIENQKGTETKYLLGLSRYVQLVLSAYDSEEDVARAIKQLYDTKASNSYCDLYFASNKSIHARFCADFDQFRAFFSGMDDIIQKCTYVSQALTDYLEEDDEPVFDIEKCSPECLELLPVGSIDQMGRLQLKLHSKAIPHEYHSGEVLRNSNGRDYMVLEVLSPDNLLLMELDKCQFLVGVNTKYYRRSPEKYEDFPSDFASYQIEWGWGIYLGDELSDIPFETIRERYGLCFQELSTHKREALLSHEFRLYDSLSGCSNVSRRIRNAAKESMDLKFKTSDFNQFSKNLATGVYDHMLEDLNTAYTAKSLAAAADGIVDGEGTYNIGFNGSDEVDFDVLDFIELEELWERFCKEEGCRTDSVDYVIKA